MDRRSVGVVGVIAGVFSACFWVRSALAILPAMGTYGGAMPADAPYQLAVNAAASWNALAAIAAAVAQTIAFGLSMFLRRR
jgi:hypothetical protein